MSKKEKQMEGGVYDRKSNPLYLLKDYIEGKAPYVSLACDHLGGPPGNVKRFRKYGFEVWIPKIYANINSFIDTAIPVPIMIDFRLVETGGHFLGDTKKVAVASHEPIDVCWRVKPNPQHSFSGLLTELWLIGKP